MKKSILTILVVAMLIGAVSVGVMARGQGFGGPMNGGAMTNSFNLSAEQQQKILAIRQEFQKENMALRFELQKKTLELRQLWAAQSLNQGAIDAKTREVTALQVKMTEKSRVMYEKIKAVLTPEQQKLMEERNFNDRSGYGGRGRRGGGMRQQGAVFNA